MTQYTSPQSVLDAALGDYHAKGFRLAGFDGYALILYYEDVRVAAFSPTGATTAEVREACREFLSSQCREGVR